MPATSRLTVVRGLLAVVLVVLTLLVFWQIRGHEFIGLDDTRDITGNRWVPLGLTLAGFLAAWTDITPPYWHPLTTVSHMVDVELFGLRPGGHLMMNVVLHLASALLLFLALGVMTARWGRSVCVAILFAVHPLHVESVAWAAERKDVLSALFWMLALGAYARYAKRPHPGGLLPVAFLMALGLLAKPVLVTLPLVLLLLDFWPLGRRGGVPPARPPFVPVIEKIPLALLALPFGAVTWFVVGKTTVASYPAGIRLENALISPWIYLLQTIWPAGLAVFYPHPASVGDAIPFWQAGLSLGLLAGVSLLVCRLRRLRPWLFVGWFWYLITLAPVLGIVQNWEQARADRFTYLPLIGIFLAIVWEAGAWVERAMLPRWSAALGAAALAAACTFLARQQAGYWRNGETLFGRALAVTEKNWLAHAQLGVVRLRQGRLGEAEENLRRALALRPLYPVAHNNLAIVLDKTGRPEEAAREYEEAIREDRGYADAAVNLGTLLFRQGRVAAATERYREALGAQPSHTAAHFNLGLALESAGRWEEAVGHYEAALRDGSRNWFAHARLGFLYARQGRIREAIAQLRRAQEIDPDDRTVAAELRRLADLQEYGAGDDLQKAPDPRRSSPEE